MVTVSRPVSVVSKETLLLGNYRLLGASRTYQGLSLELLSVFVH